jgi:hypothetical protein
MPTFQVQDGQGDPPPPSSPPVWPPPRMVALLYTSTVSSAISLVAFYLSFPMVAVIAAGVATVAGAINIAMLSRQ